MLQVGATGIDRGRKTDRQTEREEQAGRQAGRQADITCNYK
jgi:hypothetical protein